MGAGVRLCILLYLSPSILATDMTMTATSGSNMTMRVPGNTREGCKFVSNNVAKTFSCCYSTLARGDGLCDPTRQDSRCRNKSTFRVEEAEEACVGYIHVTNPTDSGQYLVVFPGALSDNKWVQVIVEEEIVEETTEIELQDFKESTIEIKAVTKAGAVDGGIITAVIVLGFVFFGIVLVVFKWKKVKEWLLNDPDKKLSDQNRGELGETDETDGAGGKDDLVVRIQVLEESVRNLEESREILELRKIVESQRCKIDTIERRLEGGYLTE